MKKLLWIFAICLAATGCINNDDPQDPALEVNPNAPGAFSGNIAISDSTDLTGHALVLVEKEGGEIVIAIFEDGHFAAADVPPGNYKLLARDDEGNEIVLAEGIEISESEGTVLEDVEYKHHDEEGSEHEEGTEVSEEETTEEETPIHVEG